jgi:hypothetical protein
MGAPLPPTIVRVRPDRLELAGETDRLRASLKETGFATRLQRNDRLQLCITFDSGGGAFHENAELHQLLRWLLGEGVLVMERYGEMDSPAELMRLLHADGVVPAFDSVIVRAPEDWETFRNPPARRRRS